MENDNMQQDSAYTQSAQTPDSTQRNSYTVIFVLGICSVIAPLFIPVIGVIAGLVCGIVGLVLANRAKQSARLDGLGQAGFILSIIGTALCGIVVAVALVVLIVGLSAVGGIIGSAAPFWAWF